MQGVAARFQKIKNPPKINKKTQKKQPPVLASILLEALVHLDSDGVQAVSNLVQLRVAFTNLLTPKKKETLELQRKATKVNRKQMYNETAFI